MHTVGAVIVGSSAVLSWVTRQSIELRSAVGRDASHRRPLSGHRLG